MFATDCIGDVSGKYNSITRIAFMNGTNAFMRRKIFINQDCNDEDPDFADIIIYAHGSWAELDSTSSLQSVTESLQNIINATESATRTAWNKAMKLTKESLKDKTAENEEEASEVEMLKSIQKKKSPDVPSFLQKNNKDLNINNSTLPAWLQEVIKNMDTIQSITTNPILNGFSGQGPNSFAKNVGDSGSFVATGGGDYLRDVLSPMSMMQNGGNWTRVTWNKVISIMPATMEGLVSLAEDMCVCLDKAKWNTHEWTQVQSATGDRWCAENNEVDCSLAPVYEDFPADRAGLFREKLCSDLDDRSPPILNFGNITGNSGSANVTVVMDKDGTVWCQVSVKPKPEGGHLSLKLVPDWKELRGGRETHIILAPPEAESFDTLKYIHCYAEDQALPPNSADATVGWKVPTVDTSTTLAEELQKIQANVTSTSASPPGGYPSPPRNVTVNETRLPPEEAHQSEAAASKKGTSFVQKHESHFKHKDSKNHRRHHRHHHHRHHHHRHHHHAHHHHAYHHHAHHRHHHKHYRGVNHGEIRLPPLLERLRRVETERRKEHLNSKHRKVLKMIRKARHVKIINKMVYLSPKEMDEIIDF